MSKYILKTKKGEVIKATQQESLELAIEFFSLTKNLSPERGFFLGEKIDRNT